MNGTARPKFKIASEPWEFEQIHRLNHATFAEEIPQHDPSPDRRLPDRFHGQNTYVICLRGKELLGMVCVRGERPFSLDGKIDDLDSYLPAGRSICEVRLLSVTKGYRNSRVLPGLLDALWQWCKPRGYDMAVISGTTRQLKLYERMGFVPFGPQVGTARAQYQPMFIKSEAWEDRSGGADQRAGGRKARLSERFVGENLLTGPPRTSLCVEQAMGAKPVSHRLDGFVEDFRGLRKALCDLTGANNAQILCGPGTMANDVIAGQLSLAGGRGLIPTNGEFGERIVGQARRAGLAFDAMRLEWGESFDVGAIEARLDADERIEWLWATHLETSTGMLNDLEGLKELCAERSLKLCMDCVSSIGLVPLDLHGVFLASGTSGKALGAYPGLALVFHRDQTQPAPRRLPAVLDLGLYAREDGIPFTISSNLIDALRSALGRFGSDEPFETSAKIGAWLRVELARRGFEVMASASPSPVVTLCLPADVSSAEAGRRLEGAGYALGWRSDYLRERNWLQMAPMGRCSPELFSPALDFLQGFARDARGA